MEHQCKHEGTIAVMHRDVKEIKRLLQGNGTKGLVQEFYDFRLYTIIIFVVIGLGGISSGTLFFNLLKTIIMP